MAKILDKRLAEHNSNKGGMYVKIDKASVIQLFIISRTVSDKKLDESLGPRLRKI